MFEDKVVLVTGTSRGIGSNIAQHFLEQGAKVIGISRTKNDSIDHELFEPMCVDVTSEVDVNELVMFILEKHKKIDVLVNNAGINKDSSLLKMEVEVFKDVIDVNLLGTFIMTKSVSKVMKEQKQGKIVNLSSVAARNNNYGQSNYAASKGAIEAFTRASAVEMAKNGINVNAVAPGCVKTNMFDHMDKTMIHSLESKIPVRRFALADEVSSVVLFLCSEGAQYITGETVTVDGGLSISIM